MAAKRVQFGKILIVGGGNMGSAFAKAFMESKLISAANLVIVDSDRKKCTRLKQKLGCQTQTTIPGNLSKFKIVVLAIKPQQLESLSEVLGPKLHESQILISILAGITIQKLRLQLAGHKKIILCMPNLPVQLGLGLTVIYPAREVGRDTVDLLKTLLAAAGPVIEVKDPKLLDAATAVSASGCGFVFYLLEGFISAAIKLGYSARQADVMVYQVFLGALGLWKSTNLSPSKLRAQVTSKGGTTAAGLAVFENTKLQASLIAGIEQAYNHCAFLRKSKN